MACFGQNIHLEGQCCVCTFGSLLSSCLDAFNDFYFCLTESRIEGAWFHFVARLHVQGVGRAGVMMFCQEPAREQQKKRWLKTWAGLCESGADYAPNVAIIQISACRQSQHTDFLHRLDRSLNFMRNCIVELLHSRKVQTVCRIGGVRKILIFWPNQRKHKNT